MTRYAVMKHLDALEEGNLVVSRRDGRSRRLYLNPMPLQSMYERWLSKYSSAAASGLSNLKRDIEEETMARPEHVFRLFIRTTPERLWEALTDPEQTQKYYFDTRVESSFDADSPIRYVNREGETAIEGEIVEAEKPRRLVHTFDFPHNDDAPTRVTFEIEKLDEQLVELTVLHDEFDGESETYHSTEWGWPRLLNGLKSYLETGEALEFPRDE